VEQRSESGSARASSRPLAWLTLVVITLIYAMNVADRFIFSTLVQPIKAEFSLSDTGIASLNTALGVVLMSFGIPAGMLADRISRRILLGLSTLTFSLMTALSGLALGLHGFLAARCSVSA
jgi:predicted MFS family arabinose efflux permease